MAQKNAGPKTPARRQAGANKMAPRQSAAPPQRRQAVQQGQRRQPAPQGQRNGQGNGQGRYATPYERNDNSGALFQNDRKERETQPDYKGQALVNGQEFWISGWKKVSAGGKPYMSLSLQFKEPQPDMDPPPEDEASWGNGQDDIPF